MGEFWKKNYAKWKKPVTYTYFYDFINIKYPEHRNIYSMYGNIYIIWEYIYGNIYLYMEIYIYIVYMEIKIFIYIYLYREKVD